MDLVIDANILFSVCITSGKAEELIFSEEIHLFSPEFLFEEFNKYREVILEKTKRDKKEFDNLLTILKKKIETISNEETEDFINLARKLSPDPKDADYFALALKLNCQIWSNDKKLKDQKRIQIISTEELIKLFNI
ncbi:PIN domain-containing protein [Candidatus Woesearchaeota archaeon]|nr:PIN domain-containing protein [Candidatus Woesearchaeota archaeon]